MKILSCEIPKIEHFRSLDAIVNEDETIMNDVTHNLNKLAQVEWCLWSMDAYKT